MTEHELEQQRQGILKKMGALRTMRRGTVSEQFLAVPHKGQAQPVLRGPYYLWQYWEHGVPKRQRLHGASEVKAAREEVAAHKEFERLCDQYVCTAEALAKAEGETVTLEEAVKKGVLSRSSKARKLRG